MNPTPASSSHLTLASAARLVQGPPPPLSPDLPPLASLLPILPQIDPMVRVGFWPRHPFLKPCRACHRRQEETHLPCPLTPQARPHSHTRTSCPDLSSHTCGSLLVWGPLPGTAPRGSPWKAQVLPLPGSPLSRHSLVEPSRLCHLDEGSPCPSAEHVPSLGPFSRLPFPLRPPPSPPG